MLDRKWRKLFSLKKGIKACSVLTESLHKTSRPSTAPRLKTKSYFVLDDEYPGTEDPFIPCKKSPPLQQFPSQELNLFAPTEVRAIPVDCNSPSSKLPFIYQKWAQPWMLYNTELRRAYPNPVCSRVSSHRL